MWIPVCNMFPLKSVTWDWCRAGVSWNHGADVAGADASTCFESSRLECQPGCIFPTSKHLVVHLPDFCSMRPSSRSCSVATCINLEVEKVRQANEWKKDKYVHGKRDILLWSEMNQDSYKDDSRWEAGWTLWDIHDSGVIWYLFRMTGALWTLVGQPHKEGANLHFYRHERKGKSTLKKREER